MTPNVQLVFRGEVLDGFAADEVRRQRAQALKLDEARVAQLFTGVRTVQKRSSAKAKTTATTPAPLPSNRTRAPSPCPTSTPK